MGLEPKALRKEHVMEMHGHRRVDPYFWMNDRENPEVISHLEAENAYRKSGMEPVNALEETLYQEMVGRIPQVDESVPVLREGYWYYTRYEEGKEYPLHCRKRDQSGDPVGQEELLLDVNVLAEGHAYCQVSGLFLSPDHQEMVYGVDFVSRRRYDLFRVRLGEQTPPVLVAEGTAGSAAWSACGNYLFYPTKDDQTLRVDRIWRLDLRSVGALPDMLFHELDEAFSCTVYRTKSKKFLAIATGSSTSDEMHILPADQPLGEWTCFQPRQAQLEYGAAHYQDRWYIRTNAHGAENFQLMECPEVQTTLENWKVVVPHRPDVLLEGMELFADYLVLEERFNGLTRIVIKPWDSTVPEHEVAFQDAAYTAYVGSNPEYQSDWLRMGYTSLVQPSQVFDYHMATRERRIRKVQQVVGGYTPGGYETDRLWASATDGTQIPISVVRPAGTTGPIPFLVYGYGSYGYSLDPAFSSARLSWLDRGCGFAMVHIRGGQEMGRPWYDRGKMEHKMNTFTDFVACSEHLVAAEWADAKRLYAMGGSAGGLLMGAVIQLRPEMFKGVVAAVPFVDVVTTMLDDSIPLTTGEYEEWGNPNEPDAYHRMLSYSPYDQVSAMDYPALLVTTGLHDSQVQYWEPAKWVAKIRAMRTNRNPLFLHCDMETGHGGASGRFQAYRDVAMEYAFLLGLDQGLLTSEVQ
jgi:oligopeptidase B